jgi:hypothetical protein
MQQRRKSTGKHHVKRGRKRDRRRQIDVGKGKFRSQENSYNEVN